LNERNLIWHDDFKRRLYSKIVAEELGIAELALEKKLEILQSLMPDAADKMKNMNIGALASLLDNLDELPMRLMIVKKVWPEANASLVSIRSPELLSSELYTMEELEARLQCIADELRDMFPNLNMDKVVEENPEVMDVDGLKDAMVVAREMGISDLEGMMGRDPQAILGFQRGGRMISGGH